MIQGLPILNNPKDLDLFYKTDLDFWDCSLYLITEEIWQFKDNFSYFLMKQFEAVQMSVTKYVFIEKYGN